MNTNEAPRPKPAPPKPKPPVTAPVLAQPAPKEKPKFVRKPHLTQKPFAALASLKVEMEAEKRPKHRGQRRNKKETK